MKSNKGFTLIELLAVIVILAIIALIATPTILGVIETARKGAAESSALGYIDAVEKQVMLEMVDSTATAVVLTGEGRTIPTSLPITDSLNSGLKVKGEKPSTGTIAFKTDGTVTSGTCMEIKASGTSYKVTYDGSKATATAGEQCS